MPRPRRTLSIVQRGEIALGELDRSVTTKADKLRVDRLRMALHALDEEQAQLRLDIEDLCDEYTNPNAPSDDCERLVRELRTRIALPAGRPS